MFSANGLNINDLAILAGANQFNLMSPGHPATFVLNTFQVLCHFFNLVYRLWLQVRTLLEALTAAPSVTASNTSAMALSPWTQL
jgi:hypothetical protein